MAFSSGAAARSRSKSGGLIEVVKTNVHISRLVQPQEHVFSSARRKKVVRQFFGALLAVAGSRISGHCLGSAIVAEEAREPPL
jgi:hypothetical protein